MKRFFISGVIALFLLFSTFPDASYGKEPASPSLTNPLRKYLNFKALRPFSEELRVFTDEILKDGDAAEIAVYFRSLNDGVWIGINERVLFAPASLMKVPIMMAYLKKAQKNPSLLKEEIPAVLADEFNQFLSSKTRLTKGEKYTVDYLLELMIRDSNNDAMKTLTRHIDVDAVLHMYDQLGYSAAFEGKKDFLSLKSYVGTFRVLYNATYLNVEMSEKALGYLSRTEFSQGISAGIPEGVKVAHKFGEYGASDADVKQLHDVGIIYHSENPYLLGVMTRGSSYTKLAKVIERISQFIYNEVDFQYKSNSNDDFPYKFEGEA